MPDSEARRLPTWPLSLTLAVVSVVEVFFIVMLSGEGVAGNISMLVNSVGIIAFCVLTWRGIPGSRWLLLALLVWRLATMGVDMVSHMAPGDKRIVGSLLLAAIYVAAGALIASPLGRSSRRE